MSRRCFDVDAYLLYVVHEKCRIGTTVTQSTGTRRCLFVLQRFAIVPVQVQSWSSSCSELVACSGSDAAALPLSIDTANTSSSTAMDKCRFSIGEHLQGHANPSIVKTVLIVTAPVIYRVTVPDAPLTDIEKPNRRECIKCGNAQLMTLVGVSLRTGRPSTTWRCGRCGHNWTDEHLFANPAHSRSTTSRGPETRSKDAAPHGETDTRAPNGSQRGSRHTGLFRAPRRRDAAQSP